ncbi:uncharacterized protein HKW66_Vig0119180 [Vigna angularis]|uniref:Uncharacterized protein n=1 Tax=Phaseolus angularis TaxID=3914 RepID=A0A8T0JW70_PHAAN|nr:uncharacterized protein HKW66_Vig0119180 [Vigna angularis]
MTLLREICAMECILQSFVNTPVILERFVSLENEILHIESSFQANALSMSNGTPYEDNFLSCRDTSINVFNVNLKCHHDLDDGHLVDAIIDHVIDTSSITTTIEEQNGKTNIVDVFLRRS